MTNYLKVGERYKTTKSQGVCIFCHLPKANARFAIQVNDFRGDDIVYKAHWNCLSKLKDNEILTELFNRIGVSK